MNHFVMQYTLGNKLSVEMEGNTLVYIVKLTMELCRGWESDLSPSEPSPQTHSLCLLHLVYSRGWLPFV